MEIEKNRATIPCYWESQPSGCLKSHCSFLHIKQRGGTGNTVTDTKSAILTPANVAMKASIPFPVVEPVVVNPEDDVDDSSSVEVSPVKKIAFSSNTIRFGAKERKPVEAATGEGSLDFGIKTLSQLRKTNDIRGFSTSQAAVGEPVTKAGSQRKFISLRNVHESQSENENWMKEEEEKPRNILSVRSTTKPILHVGNKEDVNSDRHLIVSQDRRLPIRSAVKLGGDSSDSTKFSELSKRVRRLSGERSTASAQVLNKVSEKGDAGIKSLEQIRRERRVRVSPALSPELETGVKSLAEIRRERRAVKVGTKASEDTGVVVKSLTEIKKERTDRGKLGEPCSEGDVGVKTLEQIRQEKLGESSVPDNVSSGRASVKNLEQIRRERIAKRLGLTDGNRGKLDNKDTARKLIVRREQADDLVSESVENEESIVGSVLKRLGPAVTDGDGTISKRKIAVKQKDLKGSAKDQHTPRQLTVVRKESERSDSSATLMTQVKPKRRRVTLLSEVVNNHQQGESNVENRVKARLGTLTEPEKRDVADRRRSSEDGEGGEDKQGKRLETRQPPKKKKITIRRNEDSLKNPVKRRADRQIYQPPAAKFKGASSRTGSQSESQEVGEDDNSNEMIENSPKEAKIQRNLLRTKRPRITFQSDEVDTNVAGLKVKRRNLTDQSEERNVDKEEDGLASGVVKLNPLREESKQPAKLSYGKRQRGVGLRERLLQQSQKFAVGAAAAVGDENKEKETIPNSRDVNKEKESLPNSGQTVLTPSSLKEGLGNVHGEKVQHNLEEKEQSVVSSSGVRSGISEEKVVLSPVNQVEGNWLQEVKVDQLVEKPSSTTTTATSGDVSLSSDVHITPDSTNVPIPSAAVVPLVSTLIPTQLEKDGVDVKKDVEGRERKDSVTKRRRLSIVDDEFAGLLDDVEVGEDEFNDEDDDDTLLEELEDLINS
ncbi:uncharacterized protein [Apostichopus japonicus]